MPPQRVDDVGVLDLDDDLVVYDGQSHEVHLLDPVAALLWEACDGARSLDDLTALLLKASPVLGRAAAAAVVGRTLARLADLRLLVEPG
jgi:PqqD family protein of HPr-rel-A system